MDKESYDEMVAKFLRPLFNRMQDGDDVQEESDEQDDLQFDFVKVDDERQNDEVISSPVEKSKSKKLRKKIMGFLGFRRSRTSRAGSTNEQDDQINEGQKDEGIVPEEYKQPQMNKSKSTKQQ